MSTQRLERMSLAKYATRAPVLAIIVLALDLLGYAACVYGAVAAETLWVKLLFGFLAGTMIAFCAIAGHDAGHGSLSLSRRFNRVFGTIAFLPALHPLSLWEYHHNRVHHRFTAQLGVDNSFPPMTVEQWQEATTFQRWHYRFIRSVFGQPFFYLVDVWVGDIILPFGAKSPKLSARDWFDLIAVYLYFPVFIALTTWVSFAAAGGQETWSVALADALLFGFAFPFVIWNAFISFLSVVQHTGLDVRWTVPSGQPSNVEQTMAGTVHVVLPNVIDWAFHRIMQHQAHHLNVGIPLHRLKEAQAEVEAQSGARNVKVWTPLYHWRMTQMCQLYDPRANAWVRFKDADAMPVAVPAEDRANIAA